jgi:hypothetical protein
MLHLTLYPLLVVHQNQLKVITWIFKKKSDINYLPLLISSFFFCFCFCMCTKISSTCVCKEGKKIKIDCLFVDGKFTFHFGTCIYEDKCLLFASFGCAHTINYPKPYGVPCSTFGPKTKMCPEINFMSKYPEILF